MALECEVYALPMHIMHAALLAIGVLAIAIAAEMIFAGTIMFWLAGGLATLALLADADLFSFVMTESLTFSLYSLAALSMVPALKAPRFGKSCWWRCLFGLLALTRASHVILALVVPCCWRSITDGPMHNGGRSRTPGGVRNRLDGCGQPVARPQCSVRRTLGLTEEYGSATLIERFAYNDMSAREFLLAFPYCLPEVGPPLIERAFGPAAMAAFRLPYASQLFPCRPAPSRQADRGPWPAGSADRWIAREEMSRNWWRHLL